MKIYSIARRAAELSGHDTESSFMWTEHDEVWDDLGLAHFDPAVATMLAHITARRFFYHVENWEKVDIFDQSRVSEAKLIQKVKKKSFFQRR